MNKYCYYSFKRFLRFWLVKTTRIIHHKQLLLTKNSVILNQWRQKCSPLQIIEPLTSKWRQKCSPLQIIESLTSKIIEPLIEKTSAQGCVIQQREKWPQVDFTSLSEENRRPSASVDNTLLDLQNSSYPTQPLSIIANYSNIGPIYAKCLWTLNSKLHDLVDLLAGVRPPCCDFIRRTRSQIMPHVDHADHKKGVTWFSGGMHAYRSFPCGTPLGGLSGPRSSAIMH